MDKIRIQGPCRLRGTVRASGAKNAVLPEMAATLLLDGPVTLRNVPVVRDVQTMVKVLRHLGVRSLKLEGNSLSAEGGAAGDPEAPYDLVRTMRASILVLRPLLARPGRAQVRGTAPTVVPDGIETGPFLMAAAATRSGITIEQCDPSHLESVLDKLRECGVVLRLGPDSITVEPDGALRAANVTTRPYPDFPTDLQAQFMALAARADGVSIVTETVFENRFMHVGELRRMGARIVEDGQTAIVAGPAPLSGAQVMASDLRASACLIVAGLSAEGETTIHRAYHIDRGYEKVETKFQGLGARIERIS